MTERNPHVVEQFKERQKRQLIVSAMVVIIVVGALFLSERGGELGGIPCAWLNVTAVPLMLGIVLYSFMNWRCPACNGYLGKAISPRFCIKCGAALQ